MTRRAVTGRAARICVARGCTPRRSPSGASCAMPACWTPARRVRRSVGSAPSRPRSPGSEASCPRPSAGWRGPRWRWTSWKSTRALGGDIRERAGRAVAQEALIGAYRALTEAGVTTRRAAALTGVPRATAGRRRRPAGRGNAPRPAPANQLTDAERRGMLAVFNSEQFVDRTPLQIYAALLDEGRYLCSVSSMYRILADTPRSRTGGAWHATQPGSGPNSSPLGRGRCSPGTSPSSAAR